MSKLRTHKKTIMGLALLLIASLLLGGYALGRHLAQQDSAAAHAVSARG